jgi:sentrin-specific protease 1
LHVDSNKYTGSYFEQDLVITVDNDFPDLTDHHNDQIDSALIGHPKDEALVTAFSISICRKDIQTLHGLNWLNDEVINFYMSLICERSKTACDLPKVHAFTTFFYPKLLKDGYAALRRWTRKTDVFSFDLILVPIHLGLHWTLAVVDFSCREVRYYDSMNGNNGECLRALRSYLSEEHRDKKGGVEMDLTDWNFLHNKNLPQQMNGSDCGMFACKYAEYLSRGRTTFNFNQVGFLF